MNYEINVSLDGRHLFATHERSITHWNSADKVYRIFKDKFPESEGYSISITEEVRGAKSVDERFAERNRILSALKPGEIFHVKVSWRGDKGQWVDGWKDVRLDRHYEGSGCLTFIDLEDEKFHYNISDSDFEKNILIP